MSSNPIGYKQQKKRKRNKRNLNELRSIPSIDFTLKLCFILKRICRNGKRICFIQKKKEEKKRKFGFVQAICKLRAKKRDFNASRDITS